MFAVVHWHTETDFYLQNFGFDFVKYIKTEMLKLSYNLSNGSQQTEYFGQFVQTN